MSSPSGSPSPRYYPKAAAGGTKRLISKYVTTNDKPGGQINEIEIRFIACAIPKEVRYIVRGSILNLKVTR